MAHPVPAQPDAAYAGTYKNHYYGPVAIAVRNGRLVLEIGPRHEVLPLTHWDGNTFSYMPSGENAAGITGMTFTIAPGAAPHRR